jgi:hypothetical protein
MQKLKDITYLYGGPPPSLLVARWSGVESHVPPIGSLPFLQLLHHCLYVCHLLLLLVVQLGRILHVSMKSILDLTGVDFQPSKTSAEVLPS